MTHDEIEFLISQHFDGTLDAAEAEKLRAVLDSDASARTLFEEHKRLDSVLKASKVDLDIDQEWLTSEIAGHIDEANARTFKVSRWTAFAPMAAAATLLIGLSISVFLWKDNSETRVNPVQVANSVELGVPLAKGEDVAIANVSVGIPSNMTPAMMSALFLADQRHSGKVVIQPAGQPHHDQPFD